MSALVDPRTILAVSLMLVFASFGLGRDFPIATHNPLAFFTDLVLFAGYVYLMRTLFRLPFALVILYRRARYAHDQYRMDWRESMADGLTSIAV
jgi:hypothetical protein